MLSSSLRPAGVALLTLLLLASAGCAVAPQSSRNDASPLLRKAAQCQQDPVTSAGLYLSAAEENLSRSADGHLPAQARAQALVLYNQAVGGCVTELQRCHHGLRAMNMAPLPGATSFYQLRFATGAPSDISPEQFDKLIPSQTIPWKQLKRNVHREGIGGTFVGLQNNPKTKTPNRSPVGFVEPVTALASFGRKSSSGKTPVTLSLINPTKQEEVTLREKNFPGAGDFTAPLAYLPKKDSLLFGFLSMIQSNRVAARQGIYFCEPYDPEKIPVLFVHGLASSPHAWMEFINNLNGSPEFRRRYQVWVYLYPSGTPILINALRLRASLAEIDARHPHHHKIVIVGHSMGGILARLQVTNSDNTLWNMLFRAKAEPMKKLFPDDSLIKRALFFKANPHIKRVIFVATPHRGSSLARNPIASLPSRLIRMPGNLIRQFNSQLRSALLIIDPSLKSIPTSIYGLSPLSPVLKAVDKTTPNVPFHSIIGNRGQNTIPLAQSSDGVVPYWSSHLENAASELIVPTGHDAFNSEASVAEILRILHCEEK